MKNVRSLMLTALAVAASLSTSATAQTITAQNYIADPSGLSATARVAHGGDVNSFGQVFTATAGGPLHSIDVVLKLNGTTPAKLVVRVWPVSGSPSLPSGGFPTGTPLAISIQTHTLTSQYGWYSFSFAGSGLNLVPGQRYCWMLSGVRSIDGYDMRGQPSASSYPDGAAVSFLTGDLSSPPQFPFTFADLLFVVRVGDSPVPCPLDLSEDGFVDADDIFKFLSIWFGTAGNPAGPGPGQPCPGAPGCPGDWNNNGVVDADDIFAYLNDWFAFGPGSACP